MTRIFGAKEAPKIGMVLLVVESELVFSRPCLDLPVAVLSLTLEWLLLFVDSVDMTLQVGVVCERLAECTIRLGAKHCLFMDILEVRAE